MEQLQLAICFFQARNAEGKLVAVKALSLQSMSDWKQLELFQREANTLKQLQHPGIPQYVADFEDDTEQDRGYYLVQVSGCLAKLVSANSHWLHGHSCLVHQCCSTKFALPSLLWVTRMHGHVPSTFLP